MDGTDANVAVTLTDDDPDLARILDARIYEFNVAATGLDDGRGLSMRVHDEDGELVAGLTGWTWGGCGYVDVLWVAQHRRGRGLGSLLLERAEQEARSRGCRLIALSTHTFQAPEFYRRRGYVETGRTEGYPNGFAQLHLSKALE